MRAKTTRLANIIGRKVIDARGQKVGHVVDILLDRDDRFRVTAIEVGSIGWVHRLNIVGTIRRRRDVNGVPRIRWDEIATVEHDCITLTQDAEISPPASHK